MPIINVLAAWYARGANLTSCRHLPSSRREEFCNNKTKQNKTQPFHARPKYVALSGIKARDCSHSYHRKWIENVPEAHNQANWKYSRAKMGDL